MRFSWRYRAIVRGLDGRRLEFVSPDVRVDPRWADEDMGRFPIERLEFYLPTGHAIVMSGMESYCLFLEAVESFSGGKPDIVGVWLCGKLPEEPTVEMWRIGEGKVIRQRKPYGKEWGGTAISGWKPGYTAGASPVSTLVAG